MTEEEKKAIEELEDINSYCNGMNFELETYKSYDFNRKELNQLGIVLNLIEKQQQEIEEKTTIIMAGAEKVKVLEKEIEELKAINNIQKYRIEIIDERELISKQKIKDKIEEYLEYDKKYKRYLKDGRECFTDEYFKAKTLQELLKESE